MKSAALEVFYEVESNGFTSDQNELSCHGVGDIVRDRVLHLRGRPYFSTLVEDISTESPRQVFPLPILMVWNDYLRRRH